MSFKEIEKILGKEAKDLLSHQCKTVSKEKLHIPGPDWIDRIFTSSDRNIRVLRSLQSFFSHGRLKDTGYRGSGEYVLRDGLLIESKRVKERTATDAVAAVVLVHFSRRALCTRVASGSASDVRSRPESPPSAG